MSAENKLCAGVGESYAPLRAGNNSGVPESRFRALRNSVFGSRTTVRTEPDPANRSYTMFAWNRPGKLSGPGPLSFLVEALIGNDDTSSLAAPRVGDVAQTSLRRSEA